MRNITKTLNQKNVNLSSIYFLNSQKTNSYKNQNRLDIGYRYLNNWRKKDRSKQLIKTCNLELGQNNQSIIIKKISNLSKPKPFIKSFNNSNKRLSNSDFLLDAILKTQRVDVASYW
jgi:hypothetical protein